MTGNLNIEKIKAILFDYDNTLGDRNRYAYDLYREVVESNTEQKDPMLIEEMVQECMTWDQYGYVNKNEVKHKLKEKYNLELPYENFDQWWDANLWRYSVVFPDVPEALKLLKEHYLIGCVTNGVSSGQRKKLETAGIESLFDTIVVSEEVGQNKPHPAIFLKACKALNVKQEEVMFVGDSFEKDIMGAYNLRMQPVWIWPDDHRQCHADILKIHKISELLEILKLQ